MSSYLVKPCGLTDIILDNASIFLSGSLKAQSKRYLNIIRFAARQNKTTAHCSLLTIFRQPENNQYKNNIYINQYNYLIFKNDSNFYLTYYNENDNILIIVKADSQCWFVLTPIFRYLTKLGSGLCSFKFRPLLVLQGIFLCIMRLFKE